MITYKIKRDNFNNSQWSKIFVYLDRNANSYKCNADQTEITAYYKYDEGCKALDNFIKLLAGEI